MYLFLIFIAVDENTFTTFDDGLKMIKKSLLFESRRKNITFSYLLILLELALVSAFIATFYAASVKILNVRALVGICLMLVFIYILLSASIYCLFDEDDYYSIRPVILDAETVERLENVLTNEESENSQQISVSTNCIASD